MWVVKIKWEAGKRADRDISERPTSDGYISKKSKSPSGVA
jgi:hypothetical protein